MSNTKVCPRPIGPLLRDKLKKGVFDQNSEMSISGLSPSLIFSYPSIFGVFVKRTSNTLFPCIKPMILAVVLWDFQNAQEDELI